MQRRILLVLALIVLAALAWWAWSRGAAPAVPGLDAEASKPTPAVQELSPAPGDGSARRLLTDERKESVAPLADGAGIAVVGRILDTKHEPVKDAIVQLRSPGEPWAPGAQPPEYKEGNSVVNAYRTSTDATGVFRFEVPQPRATWFELSSGSSIYLARLFQQFAHTFHSGTNDLGDFVLDARGAIAGVVRNADGTPVQWALVSSPSAPASLSTDERGRYTLGSITEGETSIFVYSTTHLKFEQHGITVVNGATTFVDVVLEVAPVLAGHVMEMGGAFVSDAEIVAQPVGERWPRLPVRTGKDGSFEVHLLQHARWTLYVWCPGFVPQRLAGPFEEGNRDIEIRLVKAPQITFQVVDDASGTPIEKFGIEVVTQEKLADLQGYAFYRYATHPDGKVVLAAVPGEQFVRVAAAACANVELPVVPDANSTSVQTVRMSAGASIRGVLQLDGRALGQALVVARRSAITSSAPADAESAGKTEEFDLSMWLGIRSGVRTDENGRFDVTRLPPGTWSLTITHPSMASRTLEPVHVGEHEERDVGTLDMLGGATLVGHLLVPDGRRQASILIDIEPPGEVPRTVSDEAGSFRFEGLTAGKHRLVIEANEQSSTGQRTLDVELAAGETKEITVDLKDSTSAHVRVRVARANVPIAGAHVSLDVGGRTVTWPAGTTGTDGWAEIACPSGEVVTLFVPGVAQSRLGATAPMTLSAEQHVDAAIDVVSGTLELDVTSPPGAREPSVLAITLTGPDDRRVTLHAATASVPGVHDLEWSSSRIHVGEVPPGRWSVEAVLRRPDGAGGQSADPLRCDVEVRAGEVSIAQPH